MMSVQQKLQQIKSRGSVADKPGSLALLHESRKKTLSQFWTVGWLADFMWSLISPALKEGRHYSLFDNSVGAASLFRNAVPGVHTLSGIDIDRELVMDVSSLLDGTGFDIDVRNASMADVELGSYSVGLINPPFSIPLLSANLKPYPGITHFGRHGPNSSALSHEYALAQALSHCDIVAAIIPRSTTLKLAEFGDISKRLCAIYRLPRNAFRDENVAFVEVDLLVFAKESVTKATIHHTVAQKDVLSGAYPLPELVCRSLYELDSKPIQVLTIQESSPAITLAPTLDKRVILTRSGARIHLTFFDGVTEAKVKNALFEKRLFSTHLHRYPDTTRYAGQHKLNLHVLMLQDDPEAALQTIATCISHSGGIPVISDQLRNGIKAMKKKHSKMIVPFSRTVYRQSTPEFSAISRTLVLINRVQRGAIAKMGEKVRCLRTETGFSVTTSAGTFDCLYDHFMNSFQIENTASGSDRWEVVHPPIADTYPEAIAALERRAKILGLDKWLTWDFQVADLCELAFKPEGAICAWQMALGKTRLALSLAKLLAGRTLIVVKSRLVDELERELTVLGVPPSECRIIRTAGDTRQLSKINVISYELLRCGVSPRFPKITYAKLLRKKCKTVIADEGGLLANENSQQTLAIKRLAPTRRYCFDGTPASDYPRQMLPLAEWVFGAERSYQPYSTKGGYIEPRLFNSASFQLRGRDAFNKDFVSFEWATNEFLETGIGAKREIPKIKSQNIGRYRDWVSPMIKRRVQQEPDVKKNVEFPIPKLRQPINIDWDYEHLCQYVETVDNFAQWYKAYANANGLEGKQLNLITILARLEACYQSANTPWRVKGFARRFNGTTSKETACIELIQRDIADGRRPVVFARNPETLHRLSVTLDKLGISNLVFTGEETIKKRLKRLNTDIREGCIQVLLASLGVTQDGLNLPELNTFIFYNRSYKAREEAQAIFRLIRNKQPHREIYGEFLHLTGSIDEYMGQLMDFKKEANNTGLDFGEQVDNKEFAHFEVFIQRFLASLPLLKDKLLQMRRAA